MKIIIPSIIEQRIWHWVKKANFEVSGFGNISYNDEKGEFLVHSVCLLKQEGGSAHTDIDPIALSKAQYDLRNDPGDLRFWWHSHVQMPVFMSQQDKDSLNTMGRNGWCVAMVYNQKNERKTAISYTYETSFGAKKLAYQEDVALEVVHHIPTETEIASWDLEFTNKVTEKKWGYQYPEKKDAAGEREPAKYMGYFGYGLLKEAQAIGLTVREYTEKIKSMNDTDFNEMELKIICLLDEEIYAT